MRIEPISVAQSKLNTGQISQVASLGTAVVDAPSSTVVSINGQTLLRQRLFLSHPDVDPPMLDAKRMDVVLQPALCLHKEDRLLLGEIYEFAQSENIDLAYVDRLGSALSNYRGSDNGERMLSPNVGMFDLEGHRVSYSFTEADAATAKRIRESYSLPTTRLDRGFIDYDTNKNRSSLFHSHFGFLELVINRFSDSSEPMPVNGRFQRHEYVKNDFIKHLSKEVYDLPGRQRLADGSASDKDQSTQKSAAATGSNTPQDFSSTMRQIIQKYLQKIGLPTLFETLMRFRR
jgi:hypothetical protein